MVEGHVLSSTNSQRDICIMRTSSSYRRPRVWLGGYLMNNPDLIVDYRLAEQLNLPADTLIEIADNGFGSQLRPTMCEFNCYFMSTAAAEFLEWIHTCSEDDADYCAYIIMRNCVYPPEEYLYMPSRDFVLAVLEGRISLPEGYSV